ncbi:MICOS complex subunit mic25a-like isoform X2 [Poecilia formosa]|uniref:MICOS complex subunit mic25a-like n=1 Tax=Poecilia formosa TaxID=48698 RepID=A0A087XD19_POEFO|nr:PREDICTED: MICOS complex subunit mic25a-like isoform X2 [Poecilia formosa]
MGSGESTTRKVSFGVDDEDRVRILRGIKLSEDVLQRMRGVANIPPESSSSATSPQKEKGASRSASSASQAQSPPHRAPPSSKSGKTFAKDEQRRYEQQQTILKDRLAKMAEREREAVREELVKTMSRERQQARKEAEKAKELAQQLQKKDSQLKALDAFYKEQLAQLEQRNFERFKESKDQFHQTASVTEASFRSRNTAPVCPGLQAQILSCYKDNKDQTLKCSDLAKEYMQCINAAKKSVFHHPTPCAFSGRPFVEPGPPAGIREGSSGAFRTCWSTMDEEREKEEEK